MMREHKYRAWDKKDKKWFEPTYRAYDGIVLVKYWEDLVISLNGRLGLHTMQGLMDESLFPDRFELVEYTGLKDKNNSGDELYDKDILNVGDGYCGDHFERGGNFIIEWNEDAWMVQDAKGEYKMGLWEAVYNRSAQHIGNIYENPELLEEVSCQKE